MPKLKEKFFNKPDTLTQEKKSLGEAIKSGGMLKSAKRKKKLEIRITQKKKKHTL